MFLVNCLGYVIRRTARTREKYRNRKAHEQLILELLEDRMLLDAGGGGITPSSNQQPIAGNDAFLVREDNTLVANVLVNDTDRDGDVLTAELIIGPKHGTLGLNSNGSFSYTPSIDFNGIDTFIYRARDRFLGSGPATATITVSPFNDVPKAGDDIYIVDQGDPLVVVENLLLDNDTDIDGDQLSARLVSSPTNGSLTLKSDGTFIYVPDAKFHGLDTFTYQAHDGTAPSNVATATIRINPINATPLATNDSFRSDQDDTLIVASPGLLDNDNDVDDDLLAAALVAGPANGTLALNPDGSFIYVPNASFHGSDSFTYQAIELPEGRINRLQTLTRQDKDTVVEIGTVKFVNLEGGFFTIVSDSGEEYLPLNLDKAFQEDNLRVVFAGRIAKDVVTLQQRGTPVVILGLEQVPTLGASNVATVTIEVTPGPFDIDLKGFSHGILPNPQVKYEVTGTNADPFQVQFFTSTDGSFDAGDVPVGSITVSSISDLSLGSHTLPVSIAAIESMLANPSTTFLLAVVDPDNAVAETNEANNDQTFAGVIQSSGTLIVLGKDSSARGVTDPDDTIRFERIGANLHVVFNGDAVTVPATPVTDIMVFGNDGKDDIRGSRTFNIPMEMHGGLGNDVLVGANGNDRLFGDEGGDVINGRSGDDLLDGDGTAGAAGSRDILFGQDGNDSLIGGIGNDRLVGMAGNDDVRGGDGNDALLGRDGNDTLFGDAGTDILLGALGDDSMHGGLGDDRMFGSSGNDSLEGGLGADLLRGGAGNDQFDGNEFFRIDNAIDRIFGEGGIDTWVGLIDPMDFVKEIQMEIDNRRQP